MLASLLALTLAAPGPKDKPDPAKDIIGLWELEHAEGGSGRSGPLEEPASPLRYRFDKDGTWTVLEGDKLAMPARAVKIDGWANPATVDFTISKDSPKRTLGIFKIEGDSLTICKAYPGKDRPTKFEARPGETDYHYLMVFKRVNGKD
jgi:uncharacterized protein (TIGR03067 family)